MSAVATTRNYSPLGAGSVSGRGFTYVPQRSLFDLSYIESFFDSIDTSKPINPLRFHNAVFRSTEDPNLKRSIDQLVAMHQDCSEETLCEIPCCKKCGQVVTRNERLNTINLLRSYLLEDASNLQIVAITVHSDARRFVGQLRPAYVELSKAIVDDVIPILNRLALNTHVLYLDANLVDDQASTARSAIDNYDAATLSTLIYNLHLHGAALINRKDFNRLNNKAEVLTDGLGFTISFEALDRAAPKGFRTSFADVINWVAYATKFSATNQVGTGRKDTDQLFLRNQKLDPIINASLIGMPRRWSTKDLESYAAIDADARAINRLRDALQVVPQSDTIKELVTLLGKCEELPRIKSDLVKHLSRNKVKRIRTGNQDVNQRTLVDKSSHLLDQLYALLPGAFLELMQLADQSELPKLPDHVQYTVNLGRRVLQLREANSVRSRKELKVLNPIFPAIVPHQDTKNSLVPLNVWLAYAATTLLV